MAVLVVLRERFGAGLGLQLALRTAPCIEKHTWLVPNGGRILSNRCGGLISNRLGPVTAPSGGYRRLKYWSYFIEPRGGSHPPAECGVLIWDAVASKHPIGFSRKLPATQVGFIYVV